MKKYAFTLIELLVVIVIIGILATIGVAQFNDYQEKARFAKAQAFASQTDHVLMAETALTGNGFPLRLDFDEGSGTTAYDSSGSENNADVSNVVFSWVTDTADNSSSALHIAGWNTSIQNIANMPVDEIAFSAFIKLDSLPVGESVLPFYIANNSSFNIHPNGTARFSVDNGVDFVESNSGKIKADRWYHLLGSYKDETLRFFIDGDLIDEASIGALSFPFNINSTTGLEYNAIYLGYVGSSQAFNGMIDRVRIYPVGLDPDNL
jgi:prepilin-type N-terminal cleavage/methylation domain-containing protein